MFCSKCGKENCFENKFCFNCGNSLTVKNEVKKESGYGETSLVLGIICLASSFFVNIICFIPGIISIIYANKHKKESGKLGVGFGLSLGGMIFSFIVLLLSILFFMFIFNVITDSVSDYNYGNSVKTEFTEGLPNV